MSPDCSPVAVAALPPEKRLLSSAGAETDHSRGCAVDVSLWDPADKKEAVMTSAWGDASGRSASNDMTANVNERYRRETLVEIMRKNGFEGTPASGIRDRITGRPGSKRAFATRIASSSGTGTIRIGCPGSPLSSGTSALTRRRSCWWGTRSDR